MEVDGEEVEEDVERGGVGGILFSEIGKAALLMGSDGNEIEMGTAGMILTS